MITATRYRRGELSSCETKRFWQYQSSGAERWVPVERYESLRHHADLTSQVAAAARDWNQSRRERRAA
jgi:hypothetical protein